jgi:hypothetical protein
VQRSENLPELAHMLSANAFGVVLREKLLQAFVPETLDHWFLIIEQSM